ncbi:hypothetical protein RFI_01289 [Reticulomyxa filosa]|uniref:non-specific serine/threonine protein kinase n=1 Tax=Reticulomyxa filosa TaxID=46433 RepID=X6PCH0_RETFI|nr:hypothetical protein RFI_01289 [Reticulomyxa filosa]|eukprot:ETO35769.1 hypothetical protein RFI_01289 [Reticulomyxa filosa]
MCMCSVLKKATTKLRRTSLAKQWEQVQKNVVKVNEARINANNVLYQIQLQHDDLNFNRTKTLSFCPKLVCTTCIFFKRNSEIKKDNKDMLSTIVCLFLSLFKCNINPKCLLQFHKLVLPRFYWISPLMSFDLNTDEMDYSRQQFVGHSVQTERYVQPSNAASAVSSWPLSGNTASTSDSNSHLNFLLTNFSSCGYLTPRDPEGAVQCISSMEGMWKPRFKYPHKFLSNTLQGAAVVCYDEKDGTSRCVKVGIRSLVEKQKSVKQSSISENFLREQLLLKKICEMKDCPNTISKYICHWESNLFYYLATEYCAGGNLFHYMVHVLHAHPKFQPNLRQQLVMSANPFAYCPKEDTYLRLQMIQHVFGQIVSTVAWLHSKHICHLDLSLENVLIRNEDIFHPQIQIIDFGVSIDFSNNNDSNHNEGEEERQEQESNANTNTSANTNANSGMIGSSNAETRRKRKSIFEMNCDKHGNIRHCENVGKPGYKAFEVRMSDETRRKMRVAEISEKRAQLLLARTQVQQQHGANESMEMVIHMYDMLLRDGIKDSYNPFKADIWTLGVILYLLLFCRYPFRHADLDDDMFLVILQKRLLQYLLEQKALCWITFETFDVLNQMLQPEFTRINTTQLSVHPQQITLTRQKKKHVFQNIKKNKENVLLGINHVITTLPTAAHQQSNHRIKYDTNKTSILTTPLLHYCSSNQTTVVRHSTAMASSILQQPSSSIASQFFS